MILGLPRFIRKDSPMTDILAELNWRNLIAQYTPELPDELAKGSLTLYCGFDPTAPSLHMGNPVSYTHLTLPTILLV